MAAVAPQLQLRLQAYSGGPEASSKRANSLDNHCQRPLFTRSPLQHFAVMMARPPPTRPHIGINPSHRFSSYSTFEWAEDDAWDSASDSESQSKPSNTNSSRTTVKPSTIVATTPPQPIPQKAGRGSSGSSSSFSYTQVQVPSPSSDPSQHEPHSFKNGWTIISEEGEPVEPVDNDGLGNSRQTQTKTINRKDNAEGVVESGLAKLKLGVDSVRQDALHIVEGMSLSILLSLELLDQQTIDPLYRVRRQKPSGDSEASTSNANGNSAQLKRMLSVKSNRRRKFIDCLTAEDVSIGQDKLLESLPRTMLTRLYLYSSGTSKTRMERYTRGDQTYCVETASRERPFQTRTLTLRLYYRC